MRKNAIAAGSRLSLNRSVRMWRLDEAEQSEHVLAQGRLVRRRFQQGVLFKFGKTTPHKTRLPPVTIFPGQQKYLTHETFVAPARQIQLSRGMTFHIRLLRGAIFIGPYPWRSCVMNKTASHAIPLP
jgi:hypothetical protein